MVFHHNLFLRCLLISTLVTPTRSLIISSKLFSKLHIPRDYHPESPARISSILQHLEQKYEIVEPNNTPGHLDRALAAIKGVHDHAYVDAVKIRSQRGAPYLQPYDLDTYLSTTSYDCSLLAQCAWLDCLDYLVENNNHNFAYAITRPPGHHAEHKSGEGFCIFNFAAATAVYAVSNKLVKNVSILDFDVHYGNGVSDIVQNHTSIRYASLHQMDIYPVPPKPDGILSSSPNRNVLTVNLEPYFKITNYMEKLNEVVMPFLTGAHSHCSIDQSLTHSLITTDPEHKPDLLIVCAGYDGLASDELASGGLQCQDYKTISEAIKRHFKGPVLFGLEGGYNLRDMPIAVAASIEPFAP